MLPCIGLDRRLLLLCGLIALQAVSAGFFVGDVVADAAEVGLDAHTTYEAIATLALLLGVLYGAIEVWRALSRGRRAESALRMASGAFGQLVEERFAAWRLTPAEAEVALLTLKGFDCKEIAELRQVAEGTVRAQLAHIYVKSGTSSRGRFVSLFIDALLDSPLVPPRPDPGGTR